MNKINIVNNEIKVVDIDDSILYTFTDNLIKTLTVQILKNTSLLIDYDFFENTKLEIVFIVNASANLKLYENKNGISSKIRTKYILNENSCLNVYKFNDINEINENIVINLDGKNSTIKYILKTISIDKEKYDLIINHNNSNTTSYIKNNGVAIKEGKIIFNVSSFVPNGNKECNVNQINRIINLTNNKCKIDPNLYIDEFDVSANHSALIGKFSEQEMFYLMSRGISREDALILLIKGFLLSDYDLSNDQLNKKIEKYWR